MDEDERSGVDRRGLLNDRVFLGTLGSRRPARAAGPVTSGRLA